MTSIRRIVLIAITLALARTVSAQEQATAAAAPDNERWDVVAAMGRASHKELPSATFGNAHLLFANWNGTLLPRFYVGYYWTPHLKTDARVMLPARVSSSYFEEFPVPGLPQGGFMSTDITTDIKTIAFGSTYQFRENTFVHPYASAGVQVEWQREHRFRREHIETGYVGPFPSTPVRYVVPGLDERSARTLARPYVAGRAKVYFNARLFTRVEALIGVIRTYEAGAGLDF